MTIPDLRSCQEFAAAMSVRSDSSSAVQRARGGLRARYVRIGTSACAMMMDLVLVASTFLLASLVIHGIGLRSNDLLMVLLTVLVFVIVSFYAGTYSVAAMKSGRVAARRVLHAWAMTLGLVLLIFFTVKSSETLSRSVFWAGAVSGPFFIIVGRMAIVYSVRTRLTPQFVCDLLVEDGLSADVPAWFNRLDVASRGLAPDPHDPINLHNFSHLTAPYDRVVVSCLPERRADWAFYLQSVGCNGELIIPELKGLALQTSGVSVILPCIKVAVGPMELPDRVLKRILDLMLTVPAIIVLSPLFVLIPIAVKLDSRGPILFRQQRMGRNNRLFDVFKFRSMYRDRADGSGDRSASRGDDRVTRVGRVIRATSLDELPQLFNVLQGDMALVGPRPHALGSRAGEDLFWHVDHRYWLRHSIKPGITGLAQVRGYRGATDQQDDLRDRLHCDLEYLANWSILRDLSILVRTARVLVHSNAY